MSYRPVQKVVMICDDCEEIITHSMFTIVPESDLENFQPLHFCCSLCFKRHIIRWAHIVEDGGGVRPMFQDAIADSI